MSREFRRPLVDCFSDRLLQETVDCDPEIPSTVKSGRPVK